MKNTNNNNFNETAPPGLQIETIEPTAPYLKDELVLEVDLMSLTPAFYELAKVYFGAPRVLLTDEFKKHLRLIRRRSPEFWEFLNTRLDWKRYSYIAFVEKPDVLVDRSEEPVLIKVSKRQIFLKLLQLLGRASREEIKLPSRCWVFADNLPDNLISELAVPFQTKLRAEENDPRNAEYFAVKRKI